MSEDRIENLIRRITAARIKKGFSHENMSIELSITPTAYWKIETGQTKLTVERLFRISEILDEPLPRLLEIGSDGFQHADCESESIWEYYQKMDFFYQESKGIYEKLLESKEDQITLLKSVLKMQGLNPGCLI